MSENKNLSGKIGIVNSNLPENGGIGCIPFRTCKESPMFNLSKKVHP